MYAGVDSVHTKACKKPVINSQCTRTAELTTRTLINKASSLSELYLEVDKALREAGLLEEKTTKLGAILDAREEDVKLAIEKEKRGESMEELYISMKSTQMIGGKFLCMQ